MSLNAVAVSEDEFIATDGLTLFTRHWQPASSPRAAVVLVHGALEHSGRYEHVAAHLNAAGYALYAFDLRGHGRSEGERAYVRDAAVLLDDVEQYLASVRTHTSARDVFLLGHSVGGALVTLLAIEREPDIRGLIVSAPAVQLHPDLSPAVRSPVLTRLALLLGRLVPRLPALSLDADALCRDPDIVRKYRNDPLVYTDWVCAGPAAVLLYTAQHIQNNLERVSVPLLVLHGTDDCITDVAGSRALYARAGSADKTIKVYEGFYHELFNEPEYERVLDDVVDWLNARSTAENKKANH